MVSPSWSLIPVAISVSEGIDAGWGLAGVEDEDDEDKGETNNKHSEEEAYDEVDIRAARLRPRGDHVPDRDGDEVRMMRGVCFEKEKNELFVAVA